ncbi:MAG: hypothetical protein IH594_00035 [Bacteroidales bacterium]|nr:hypothetical protein [Bacteroidales bacterium]
MIKNSTIFFIYDELNEENELYTWQDLTEAPSPDDELYMLLNSLEISPSQAVLQRIFQSALS